MLLKTLNEKSRNLFKKLNEWKLDVNWRESAKYKWSLDEMSVEKFINFSCFKKY